MWPATVWEYAVTSLTVVNEGHLEVSYGAPTLGSRPVSTPHPTYDQLVDLPAYAVQPVPAPFEDINGHLNVRHYTGIASEGLDDLHDPLHELGAELLSDLADVTDAEFTECGIPLEKGKWLRSQAQAVQGGGSGGGGGAAGIPEGVPKEDDGV